MSYKIVIDKSMSSIAKIISNLISSSSNKRWIWGNHTLVRSMTWNIPCKRSWKGEAVKTILFFSYFNIVKYLVIFFIVILDTVRLWWLYWLAESQQKDITSKIDEDINVFVTCNVQPEYFLLKEYSRLKINPIVVVHENDVQSLRGICRIRCTDLLKNSIRSINFAVKSYFNIPKEFKKYQLDWLTFGCTRIAKYAFYLTFWKKLKATFSIAEVNFIVADTAAFAAVDASLPTRYQQHGALSASIVLPAFHKVLALSFSEAEYIKVFIPSGIISHRRAILSNKSDIMSKVKAIIITSEILESKALDRMDNTMKKYIQELDTESQLEEIESVVTYFNKKGFDCYIRPRLKDSGINSSIAWDKIIKSRNLPAINCGIDKSFPDLLREINPMFVVAQSSTTLIDALYSGIIPVTLKPKAWVPGVVDTANLVFPIRYCCVHWDRELSLIKGLIEGTISYNETVNLLLHRERLESIRTSG